MKENDYNCLVIISYLQDDVIGTLSERICIENKSCNRVHYSI